MDKKLRNLILVLLIIAMSISLYVNLSSSFRWGNASMNLDVMHYEDEMSEWLSTNKSILDMFCSYIAADPDMLDDYEGTVAFLDSITRQYPQISASYMTNPAREHTVYMNNGWEPDPDKPVEDRPWFKDVMDSKTGWIVSAPYYDQPTGVYCVTMAKRVYDPQTGEVLGNFGVDFYMDKLIEVMGDDYSDAGYAFLVDAEGNIVNHPNPEYQMSADKVTNISDMPYDGVRADGKTTLLFKDYDGTAKILIATIDKTTDFRVFVVRDFIDVYGRVILYAFLCLAVFLFCIFVVYRLLTNLIRWQNEAQKKIRVAADAAIAAGEAKSQFLAQMSHEIRTPINAVLGMNEMILRESKDKDILDYADNIKSAGNTLLTLINSILDFSKIGDGKMELSPARYELAALINEVVVSISERARQKGLRFLVDVDESLPSILFGDDVRVSQIIMNLLTNAVKYTENGDVKLTMRNEGLSDGKLKLFVSVSDTGIGIREEDMEKMFESFERLDVSRNRNIEGTGLGMSIVTKLLELMGSKLVVDSVYGRGSTFSFVLLQDIADETPIGKYEEKIAITTEERDMRKTIKAPDAKVLVVDDNNMNLKVAQSLLKLCDIKADLAVSGEEAIHKMEEETYDIVLLDHMMPKMDGIETLNELKKRSLIPIKTTMIVLTANAIVGAREQYLASGFDDYLSKPMDIDELVEKLLTYLPEKLVEKEDEKPEDEVLEFAPADSKEGMEDDMGVTVGNNEKGMETAQENVYRLEALEAAGINTEEGIRYCADDEEMYFEMLDEYLLGYDEKYPQLNYLYEKKDWYEYRVLVHALKSTSKTMGIGKLYDEALALEHAAGDEDEAYIVENHKKVMDDYDKIVLTIREAKGQR